MERLIQAAANHGGESGNDYEIGDLQDLLRLAWSIMPDESRHAFGANFEVEDLLENWEEDDESEEAES